MECSWNADGKIIIIYDKPIVYFRIELVVRMSKPEINIKHVYFKYAGVNILSTAYGYNIKDILFLFSNRQGT